MTRPWPPRRETPLPVEGCLESAASSRQTGDSELVVDDAGAALLMAVDGRAALGLAPGAASKPPQEDSTLDNLRDRVTLEIIAEMIGAYLRPPCLKDRAEGVRKSAASCPQGKTPGGSGGSALSSVIVTRRFGGM